MHAAEIITLTLTFEREFGIGQLSKNTLVKCLSVQGDSDRVGN